MHNAARSAARASELKGRQVYILSVLTREGSVWSRPAPIPFATLEDLWKHLGDIITQHLHHIVDEKSRELIVSCLARQDYPKANYFFRAAQEKNRDAIPLDYFWDFRPTIIM